MSLTPDEQRFMAWWEMERHKYKRRALQWWLGFPLGALFSIPILLNFFAGRFWYKRADAVGSSQFNPTVLIVAVILIAGFMGYISRRFKWEQNEARYHTFRMRDKTHESVSEENPKQ